MPRCSAWACPRLPTRGDLAVRSPLTGEVVAHVPQHTPAQASDAIGRAHAAFATLAHRACTAQGELIRLLGEELRAAKADLGRLVTLEAGKIPSEGLGEVQGDDRHLRLCRGPVAPALRPDDCHRAPRPPHDGNLAPAGRVRRHLCVQLPVAV